MKKTFVIGIAGGSASGKSTFCNILEKNLENLKIKSIHMDEYFKPQNERPFLKAPIVDKMYLDDNCPQTIYLDKLKIDLDFAIKENIYDVIIVEGLLTLYDENIFNTLDLKIFIDCRADERIVRRLKRNMNWGLSFDEISNVYLDMVRYRHDEFVEPSKWKADFILNGSVQSEKAISMIVNFIKQSK